VLHAWPHGVRKERRSKEGKKRKRQGKIVSRRRKKGASGGKWKVYRKEEVGGP